MSDGEPVKRDSPGLAPNSRQIAPSAATASAPNSTLTEERVTATVRHCYPGTLYLGGVDAPPTGVYF